MLVRVAGIGSVFVLLLAAACAGGENQLILATTTSTQDSGLLDVLVPQFERLTGYAVKTIAVGSGAALRLGEEGEVDVVLAHSPDAEEAFLAAGHGVNRRLVMHNDFVIVGPADDPAGVRGLRDAAAALRRIAEAEAAFLSRGDESGTHARELSSWRQAGIDPAGRSWYQESGAGQGQSLLVASDKGAYTLVDSSTFTVFRERLALEPYVFDDEPNRYSIIRVNPEKHDVNEAAALAFADFLTSPVAQRIIAEFGRERYQEPLFVAAGIASEVEPAATPER